MLVKHCLIPNAKLNFPVDGSLFLTISSTTLSEAAYSIAKALHEPFDRRSPHTIAFLNMHNYNIVCENETAFNAFKTFDCLYADGVGLQIARVILGLPTFKRLSGTDLVPHLLQEYIKPNTKVYLLGGKPTKTAELCSRFSRLFPRAALVGEHHGYFSPADEKDIIDRINASGAELLLIGMGTPRQEKWLQFNRHKLKVSTAVCVGGLFQYWDQSLMRAPWLLQILGLEWLCILLQQPRKWPNYSIGAWRFLHRVLINI